MRREPGTLFTARPCHTRERAAGHYVPAGGHAGDVLYGTARRPGHDRRQFDYTHQGPAAGRLYLRGKIVPKPPSLNDLLAHGFRAKGVYGIH